MIQKMTGPRPLSANALARQAGISQTTLSRWLRDAVRMAQFPDRGNPTEKGAIMTAKRPADWTSEEKFNLVLEAASIPEEERGAFLRRKGIHEVHLQEWRQMILAALKNQKATTGSKNTAESRRIRKLERELIRKEKALAEAAALLVLQKKVQEIWGEEENSTPNKNGK